MKWRLIGKRLPASQKEMLKQIGLKQSAHMGGTVCTGRVLKNNTGAKSILIRCCVTVL